MTQHTIQLRIAGMSCTSCSSAIKECLKDVAGVTDVTVNVGTERATVRHDSDVSAEQFTKAFESTVYEASEEVQS